MRRDSTGNAVDPQIGQVERNMEYVDKMLEPFAGDKDVDILMLPEMAFTGYVFKTREDVAQVAEPATSGKTFAWCRRYALQFHCLVTCGYVERDGAHLYNSMLVVGPDGELVLNPRKTFLYETDKSWATPGDGFQTWHCPWLHKTISFGICMDINPDDFKAPFEAYEFARHALQHKSDLILFACAWNDFEPPDVSTNPTLSYWATRLTPITQALRASAIADDDITKDCYFLCANRIGSENGTFFVGASCAIALKQPALLAHAPRREPCVLQIEVP